MSVTSQKVAVSLRLLELFFAIVVLGTAASGHGKDCSFANVLYDSTSQMTFLLVNGVLICIAIPVWVGLIHYKKYKLPHPALAVGFDFVWIVLCFSAGIAGSLSPVAEKICGNSKLKEILESACELSCSTVWASIVCTFLLFLCFIGSIFFSSRALLTTSDTDDADFTEEITPKGPDVQVHSTQL